MGALFIFPMSSFELIAQGFDGKRVSRAKANVIDDEMNAYVVVLKTDCTICKASS